MEKANRKQTEGRRRLPERGGTAPAASPLHRTAGPPASRQLRGRPNQNGAKPNQSETAKKVGFSPYDAVPLTEKRKKQPRKASPHKEGITRRQRTNQQARPKSKGRGVQKDEKHPAPVVPGASRVPLDPLMDLEVLKSVLLREQHLDRLKGLVTAHPYSVSPEVPEVLDLLREASLDSAMTIRKWKLAQLDPTASYEWDGRDYLLKMTSDLDFLDGYRPLRQWLGFSLLSNPFLIPAPYYDEADAELLDNKVETDEGPRERPWPSAFLDLGGQGKSSIPPPDQTASTEKPKTLDPSPYLTPVLNDLNMIPYSAQPRTMLKLEEERAKKEEAAKASQPSELRLSSMTSSLSSSPLQTPLSFAGKGHSLRGSRSLAALPSGPASRMNSAGSQSRPSLPLPATTVAKIDFPLLRRAEKILQKALVDAGKELPPTSMKRLATTAPPLVVQSSGNPAVPLQPDRSRHASLGNVLLNPSANGEQYVPTGPNQEASPGPQGRGAEDLPSFGHIPREQVHAGNIPLDEDGPEVSSRSSTADSLPGSRTPIITKPGLPDYEKREKQKRRGIQMRFNGVFDVPKVDKTGSHLNDITSAGTQGRKVQIKRHPRIARVAEDIRRLRRDLEEISKKIKDAEEEELNEGIVASLKADYDRKSWDLGGLVEEQEWLEKVKASSEVQEEESELERMRDQLQENEVLPDDEKISMRLEDRAATDIQRIMRGVLVRKHMKWLMERLHRAAAKIQAGARGFFARHRVKLIRLRKNAQTKIARRWRGNRARGVVKVHQHKVTRFNAARDLQRTWRGFLGRQKARRRKAQIVSASKAAQLVSITSIMPSDLLELSDAIKDAIFNHKKALPPMEMLGLLRIVFNILADNAPEQDENQGMVVTGISPSLGAIKVWKMYGPGIDWESCALALNRPATVLRRLRKLAVDLSARGPNNKPLLLREGTHRLMNDYEGLPHWSLKYFLRMPVGRKCSEKLFEWVRCLSDVYRHQSEFRFAASAEALLKNAETRPHWMSQLHTYQRKRYEKLEQLLVVETAIDVAETFRMELFNAGKAWGFAMTAVEKLTAQIAGIEAELDQIENYWQESRAKQELKEAVKIQRLEGQVGVNARALQIAQQQLAIASKGRRRSSDLRGMLYVQKDAIASLNFSERELRKEHLRHDNRKELRDEILDPEGNALFMVVRMGQALGSYFYVAEERTNTINLNGGPKYLKGMSRHVKEKIRSQTERIMMCLEEVRSSAMYVDESVANFSTWIVTHTFVSGSNVSLDLDEEVIEEKEALQKEVQDDAEMAQEEIETGAWANDIEEILSILPNSQKNAPQPMLLLVARDLPRALKRRLIIQLKDDMFRFFDAYESIIADLESIQESFSEGRGAIVEVDQGYCWTTRKKFIEEIKGLQLTLEESPLVVLVVGDWRNKGGTMNGMNMTLSSSELKDVKDGDIKHFLLKTAHFLHEISIAPAFPQQEKIKEQSDVENSQMDQGPSRHNQITNNSQDYTSAEIPSWSSNFSPTKQDLISLSLLKDFLESLLREPVEVEFALTAEQIDCLLRQLQHFSPWDAVVDQAVYLRLLVSRPAWEWLWSDHTQRGSELSPVLARVAVWGHAMLCCIEAMHKGGGPPQDLSDPSEKSPARGVFKQIIEISELDRPHAKDGLRSLGVRQKLAGAYEQISPLQLYPFLLGILLSDCQVHREAIRLKVDEGYQPAVEESLKDGFLSNPFAVADVYSAFGFYFFRVTGLGNQGRYVTKIPQGKLHDLIAPNSMELDVLNKMATDRPWDPAGLFHRTAMCLSFRPSDVAETYKHAGEWDQEGQCWQLVCHHRRALMMKETMTLNGYDVNVAVYEESAGTIIFMAQILDTKEMLSLSVGSKELKLLHAVCDPHLEKPSIDTEYPKLLAPLIFNRLMIVPPRHLENFTDRAKLPEELQKRWSTPEVPPDSSPNCRRLRLRLHGGPGRKVLRTLVKVDYGNGYLCLEVRECTFLNPVVISLRIYDPKTSKAVELHLNPALSSFLRKPSGEIDREFLESCWDAAGIFADDSLLGIRMTLSRPNVGKAPDGRLCFISTYLSFHSHEGIVLNLYFPENCESNKLVISNDQLLTLFPPGRSNRPLNAKHLVSTLMEYVFYDDISEQYGFYPEAPVFDDSSINSIQSGTTWTTTDNPTPHLTPRWTNEYEKVVVLEQAAEFGKIRDPRHHAGKAWDRLIFCQTVKVCVRSELGESIQKRGVKVYEGFTGGDEKIRRYYTFVDFESSSMEACRKFKVGQEYVDEELCAGLDFFESCSLVYDYGPFQEYLKSFILKALYLVKEQETGLYYFQRIEDYQPHTTERRVTIIPPPTPYVRPKTPGAADESDWKQLFHTKHEISGVTLHLRVYDASPDFVFEADIPPIIQPHTLQFPFVAVKGQNPLTGEKSFFMFTPAPIWEMVGGEFCEILTKPKRKRLARRLLPLLRLHYNEDGGAELTLPPFFTGENLDVNLAINSITETKTPFLHRNRKSLRRVATTVV